MSVGMFGHMGVGVESSTGASVTGQYSATIVDYIPIVSENLTVKPDILCMAHGGPIEEPEDTEYIYRHTRAVGFVGASSIERIPTEKAIQMKTRDFKSKRILR